jgi:hypothetical protein
MSRFVLRSSLAAVALVIGLSAVRADQSKQIPVLRKWDGKIKDETLRKASPVTGYVANEKEFAKLWQAWRPDDKEVPKIDFEKEIVLVGVASGPNDVRLIPQLDEKGDLQVLARASLVAGPGFGYQIAVVKREGIKTIKGKAIVIE